MPLIRGMPTGLKVFLAVPGAFGLQSCARAHQKRPCATLARSVGRATNTVGGRDRYKGSEPKL